MVEFFKRWWLFTLVVGGLLLISVATQILLHKTRASVRGDIAVYGDRLPAAIMGFERAVGYGGFIHNFKNAVLRPEEPQYRKNAERDYNKAIEFLEELSSLAASAGLEIEMSATQETLDSYRENLERLEALQQGNNSVATVDRLVRISDKTALDNIREYEHAIREAYRLRIADQISDLTFILRGLAVLSVVIPASVVLFAVAWLTKERRYIRKMDGLNTELHQQNEELELRNKELSDFAYFSSHDLRTPLRGIANNAQFLIDDFSSALPEQGRERLKKLQTLCQRTERLVEEVLGYVRLGKSHNVEKLNAAAILSKMDFTKKGEVKLETDLPPLTYDRIQFATVMRRLIDNGLTFNNASNPKVNIGYSSAANAQRTAVPNAIYVRDNGIGIDPLYHADILRLFKRLHRPGVYGDGIGSGLAFVKKIVDSNGGSVSLRSEPGSGSTFYIVFDRQGS